jgi:hypothetical protein
MAPAVLRGKFDEMGRREREPGGWPLALMKPSSGADILKAAINREEILPLEVRALFLFTAGLFLLSLRRIRRKWVL